MAKKYTQAVTSGQTRFEQAPQGIIEFSKFTDVCTVDTDFSAGDIVPILALEVLPNDTFSIDAHEVIRQATVLTPTMGNMDIDLYAFFVPNRVVNHSWKNVMGENSSGMWVAPQVSLAPLYAGTEDAVQIPVCSLADYYGYPTQNPIPASVLNQCHDLKFRGYIEIYNNFFRDENYKAPISYSKLNVYNGFLEPVDTIIDMQEGNTEWSDPGDTDTDTTGVPGDGSFGAGAVNKALFGDGWYGDADVSAIVSGRYASFSALDKPLKANKHHDYFTSVLPTPQKGAPVVVSSLTPMPIVTGLPYDPDTRYSTTTVSDMGGGILEGDKGIMSVYSGIVGVHDNSTITAPGAFTWFNNLYADPAQSSITLDDLRMSAAVQQVYEVLGRSGSRYREYINGFFGLDIDNPFDDIPTLLGHYRRDLDLYQTAQTSASTDASAQGNLSAFGYTSKGGQLFAPYTFKEHGYVHILAVVRHKNVYASLLTRDNFRLSMFDFYQYPLANISEQPVYTREINPFVEDADGVFGYQEAWAEYRYIPSRVTGHMRDGVEDSLSFWNYSDTFDPSLRICDDRFLQSNSQQVLMRSTAIQDTFQPQFKAQFTFAVTMQRPMPTYSVPGLDIL